MPCSTALQLRSFWYQGTDLCEPNDPQFRAWLATIQSLEGTNVTCGAQTVTGFVWNDANRNGAQDAGEAGIADAAVTLTQTQTAAALDAAGRRVFTDSEGRHRFDYVSTGAHAISVTKPGYLSTLGATIPITVPEVGLTVPPVGIGWAPSHVYLPFTRK